MASGRFLEVQASLPARRRKNLRLASCAEQIIDSGSARCLLYRTANLGAHIPAWYGPSQHERHRRRDRRLRRSRREAALLHALNNSNPVLLSDSPERREAEAVGWEIACDGMEVML
jgi:hypothetical protein